NPGKTSRKRADWLFRNPGFGDPESRCFRACSRIAERVGRRGRASTRQSGHGMVDGGQAPTATIPSICRRDRGQVGPAVNSSHRQRIDRSLHGKPRVRLKITMGEEKRAFKGVWICAAIFLDERLTPAEKILLAEIDSLTSDDRGCYASNAHFAK